MISKFIGYMKRSQIDTTAPPMLGPDRTPLFKHSQTNPLFAFYDPNGLDFSPQGYGPRPKPLQPHGPGGGQNYNADCLKQPLVMWNRASDGTAVMDFFRRSIGKTGLEKV